MPRRQIENAIETLGTALITASSKLLVQGMTIELLIDLLTDEQKSAFAETMRSRVQALGALTATEPSAKMDAAVTGQLAAFLTAAGKPPLR